MAKPICKFLLKKTFMLIDLAPHPELIVVPSHDERIQKQISIFPVNQLYEPDASGKAVKIGNLKIE